MFSQYLWATTNTNTASQRALGCGDQRDRRWASSFARQRGGKTVCFHDTSEPLRTRTQPASDPWAPMISATGGGRVHLWDRGVERQLRAVYATKNNTEIYLLLSNATQLSNAPLGVWPCFLNQSVCNKRAFLIINHELPTGCTLVFIIYVDIYYGFNYFRLC